MLTVGSGDLKYEPVFDWFNLPADVTLHEAIGVAVDSADRLFVFNRGRPHVIVFDREGRYLDAWDGNLVRPHGIWIAADDTVWLVDDKGHSVSQYLADGTFLRNVGPSGTPSETGAVDMDYRRITHGGPPWHMPTNVVTSSTGDIYATDGYGNARVHRFNADGELLASWGEPGGERGEFQIPHGIGIDAADRLYVADRENSRIQIYSPDGEWLSEWRDVFRPCEAFVADDGLVYVAELGLQHGLYPWMTRLMDAPGGRVSIFDQSGTLLSRWGGGHDSSRPGEFYAAHDICVDSRGDIYVGEVSVTAGELAGEDTSGLPSLKKFVRCR